ncbi:hypothetical protein ACJX0J_040641, partial [Zea mays]
VESALAGTPRKGKRMANKGKVQNIVDLESALLEEKLDEFHKKLEVEKKKREIAKTERNRVQKNSLLFRKTEIVISDNKYLYFEFLTFYSPLLFTLAFIILSFLLFIKLLR